MIMENALQRQQDPNDWDIFYSIQYFSKVLKKEETLKMNIKTKN